MFRQGKKESRKRGGGFLAALALLGLFSLVKVFTVHTSLINKLSTFIQETRHNATDDTDSTDVDSIPVKEDARSTSMSMYSDKMISENKTERNQEKDNVQVPILYPNATSMQYNNDIRIFEDEKADKFGSRRLGSLCSQSKVNPPGNDQNLTGTINECSQLLFPLSKEKGIKRIGIAPRGRKPSLNAPDECWPRLAIIVSFPTSGNFMARMLFSISTGLTTGQICGPMEREKHREIIYDWGGDSHFCLHGQTFCESNLQLPYAGRLALLKTHRSPKSHLFAEDNRNPSHIVRLVRNPGDHMLRQATRWITEEKNNDNFEKFQDEAKRKCREIFFIERPMRQFQNFHKEWERASKHIPSTFLHYEDITDPDIVGDKIAEVVEFLGETQSFDVNYTEVVRRPKYKHGTLMKEICGVDVAREIHNRTSWISDITGYSFDWEEGVWSLRDN